MELWIRSQDKKCLIKANIIEYETAAILKGSTDQDSWYHTLGKYKTKERALEVLDEIQNKICPQDCINIGYGTIVYEMPKE